MSAVIGGDRRRSHVADSGVCFGAAFGRWPVLLEHARSRTGGTFDEIRDIADLNVEQGAES